MKNKPLLARSDSARPGAGIVHFGPGAFFRAFNAIYTAEAMQAKGGDWGIVAVSLKSPTTRDQLAPQGWAYTSVTLEPEGERHEVIESIVDILVAPEDPEAVLAIMADPAIRIVSLTITEKGYCHEPATGRLDFNHPDVVHDLADGVSSCAPGFLVEALDRRRCAGIAPFTVLSCDNLPENGRLTRSIVLEFAYARDAELANWIEANVSFPSTMVDRITPATTTADIARLAEIQGYCDHGCVQHEPFRQWVIEDDFTSGRPPWEVSGVQFVASVDAHETMKLRCLNGTHSTLAYLGYLAGYETIAQTVADPVFAALCDKLWQQEILPTLAQPEGENLAEYCTALLDRYRNPAIQHRTWQIAMDGSQKLPQRILGTVTDNLSNHRPVPGLTLAIAAWMRYVGGIDEKGQPIEVKDPMATRLRVASDNEKTYSGKVAALIAEADIFNPLLSENISFQEQLVGALTNLSERGAKAVVTEFTASA